MDEAATIGGELRTAALRTAGLPQHHGFLRQIVDRFNRQPGRLVTHAHLGSGLVDGTTVVNQLQELDMAPSRLTSAEWQGNCGMVHRGLDAL